MNVDSSKLYKTITENQKELLAIRKENKELIEIKLSSLLDLKYLIAIKVSNLMFTVFL